MKTFTVYAKLFSSDPFALLKTVSVEHPFECEDTSDGPYDRITFRYLRDLVQLITDVNDKDWLFEVIHYKTVHVSGMMKILKLGDDRLCVFSNNENICDDFVSLVKAHANGEIEN